ncbi:MAG: M28 family peptidase [Deltaproteobacteria bacterium]|nr:M28 family peptidase [Deltaproteobacteria bacterium]
MTIAPAWIRPLEKRLTQVALSFLAFYLFTGGSSAHSAGFTSGNFVRNIKTLSSYRDRSTGSEGFQKAAAYIKMRFSEMGFEETGSQLFSLPVRRHSGSILTIVGKDVSVPIRPMKLNLISPGGTPPEGVEGPLVYVGSGELEELDGKEISGSIVLMELDSGTNWLYVADLGAKALIYLDRGATPRIFFDDKMEMTPVQFPRFYMSEAEARELFGPFEQGSEGKAVHRVRISSGIKWEETTAENIYCLVPGTDPERSEELIIVEAFYDSGGLVFGESPGADEATGIATLLEIGRYLKANPPARSILLVATAGHAQTLAGMRELIWSIRVRSRDLRKLKKDLKKAQETSRKYLAVLREFPFQGGEDPVRDTLLLDAVRDRVKTEVDSISRRLMRLRLERRDEAKEEIIKALAAERLLLRRLSWRKTAAEVLPDENKALEKLIPMAMEDHEKILRDMRTQLKVLRSTRAFRSLVKARDLVAIISLHLSSHGDGIGAFNRGWLQWLKPTVNRVGAYSMIDQALRKEAVKVEKELGLPSLFKDTLRPSKKRTWESYFLDKPPLGGEVSALAGYLGLSLVTVNDARQWWGTPYDTAERIDWDFSSRQNALVCGLIKGLSEAETFAEGDRINNGFSTVTGEAKFLRHGELFADQPAPGSMILAYQGPSHFYTMTDSRGIFRLKGMSDKRHVYDKVIIEGYKFHPETGEAVWAIDKKLTGKAAYRVKMYRKSMRTKLIMFACKQTTVFNLLEPRTFRYMTKINVLDGRREAKPLRYWWSRIDTRRSVIATLCLEPGTPLKMILSDTVLRKKLILVNADPERPQGVGYMVDRWPIIDKTEYRIAKDMWTLLQPRIAKLEEHGIYNERISKLREEGISALVRAERALEEKRYSEFIVSSTRAWALAARVYDDVEKTQKDVLFGVLFYIALFVPFAFCMERFLFCYSNINKRIIAFSIILILLIALIYNVHPAFELAYSPMVVILAFFIIGLSFIVTLIIFFRFEEEIMRLQSRARHMKIGEVNKWKAFGAAFLLGVSNLRRRRIRTILTCTTLIILTFTIMSFTSVKSIRHHTRILYKDSSPYKGFLLKNMNWVDIPRESLSVLVSTFGRKGLLAPRGWLESFDRTRPVRVPVHYKGKYGEAQGIVGLTPDEAKVTGVDSILVSGRWFNEDDRYSVLLPERMAKRLGIHMGNLEDAVVSLWGMPFKVAGVFVGKKLQEKRDLDGEPLTPVTFPNEEGLKITEEELEAMESGEDVRVLQGRYRHVAGDLTLVIPFKTLLAAGGNLKSISVRPARGERIGQMARDFVDRFGLTIFSGEEGGTFLYHASDRMGYSGVPNIIIPLIISVFIVLNTMISSVYERKSEIAIYTSVGLAPSHVSFLFIAESLAFAVLSVVLGYLLAQTTAAIFSGTSLWAGITVNYSSLSGVAAMILVILVVLASVVYPSRVASQIAIPDVTRSWKLPDAKDNTLEILLPIQLKYSEHRGVAGYVYSYLKAHQNVSHGIFSTGDLSFDYMCPVLKKNKDRSEECAGGSCCTRKCMEFRARVWLAPFDFGITQMVDIEFCPVPEDPEFLGIKVRLVREAGEANTWRRVNKAFLNQLRKQLLMWRSLDEEARSFYERGLDGTEEKVKEGGVALAFA